MLLTIAPASRAGRFLALDGTRLLCTSRTPLLSAARVLLAEGADPQAPLAMRHVDSDTVAMRTTVGAAAALAVSEPDRGGAPRFHRWKPSPMWAGGSPAAADSL